MKKNIVNILIILFTIIISFGTSILYEFDFISKNYVRYMLLTIVIIFELIFGWKLLKENNR